ncbi:MAG: IclR family transcriptional regulator C-terminal domain-containing protein, partial [Victivallaceae bacterium]
QMPSSHICRLLKTLLDIGYIAQRSDRRYVISGRILELSNAYLAQLEVRNIARKHLYKLHMENGFKVYLAVPIHGRALIVDMISDGNPDENTMNIGKVNSVNLTACGKVCAAFASDDDLAIILSQPLSAGNGEHEFDIIQFRRELTQIRLDTFAVADRVSSPTIYAVGAAIFDHTGGLSAVVGTFSNVPDFSEVERRNLLEQTINCANAISRDLLVYGNQENIIS